MKNGLIIDVEFQRVIPPLQVAEKEILEASILQYGVRDPITIWCGTILDGHNRYAICQDHGLPYPTKSISLKTRDDAMVWICMNQLARLNISDETRKYLIGKRYEAEKRIGARNIAGTNQYSEVSPHIEGKPEGTEKHYGASVRLSTEYCLSRTSVERYGKYAKALDRVIDLDRRIKPGLLSGAIHIGVDNLINISALPNKQIQAIAAEIPADTPYNLDQNHIVQSLHMSRAHRILLPRIPKVHQQTVKDMPAYDPDAEVSSLSLTIPSWRSSIDRVNTVAKWPLVSAHAQRILKDELATLKAIVEQMLGSILEGL
jgi:hypothetical protein